jgi:hypothetical protein
MNPEIKARWVAALRSGEYQQTQGVLQNSEGFCCLGVLCDLYAKEHGMHLWTVRDMGANDGDDEEPNDSVRTWAGLIDRNPYILMDGEDRPRHVAAFNDGVGMQPKTFAEIADAIEAQL